ncbi:MAG: PaaI family thioesterase, partial [Actinomycetota bacterium]
TPERLVARVPVEGNTQPYGLFHGGASAALAETLASVGAWLPDTSKVTMGVEIKVNHIRATREGWVTGTAVPLFTGRSISVWEIRLTDDAGRLVAFSTATIAVREPRR